MTTQSSRRSFLQQSAVGAFAATSVFGQASPNGQLQHAAIGVTGMGKGDLANISSHPKVKIVALCDIDANKLKVAAALHPDARTYTDWRELLQKEGDKVDSVNVTVPDHMHAIMGLSAMKRGKHVYCQKPLTHDVAEARLMNEYADTHDCITQMGNQIHSHIAYRSAVAYIRSGVIGKIKEVHSWCSAKYTHGPRPTGVDPIPANLDWDGWLGTAPHRPFLKELYHPFKWREWQDFGTGTIGDFGCHILDPVFSALDLTYPTDIRSEVPKEWQDNPLRFGECWPDWEIFHYTFPGTKFTTGDTIKVTWYDSGKQPPKELAPLPEGWDLAQSGSLFIGEEGVMMLPHVGGPQLLPKEKFAGTPKPDIPKNVDHYHTWVDACLAGKKTSDGFHYAGPLAEAVLLGTVANRLPGETLEWNAAALRVENNEAANKMLSRTYRTGWQIL
jgi:predicted dehydrogenase